MRVFNFSSNPLVDVIDVQVFFSVLSTNTTFLSEQHNSGSVLDAELFSKVKVSININTSDLNIGKRLRNSLSEGLVGSSELLAVRAVVTVEFNEDIIVIVDHFMEVLGTQVDNGLIVASLSGESNSG